MKTIVIGAGAAGAMAAHFAAVSGDEVTVIEKNEKIGKKIYITGKGRCNLTNDCDTDEFMENVVTNGRFLLSSISSFSPRDVMGFFEENGLILKVERGNRVFPSSDKSSDVIKTLDRVLSRDGVFIRLNETVLRVETENGRVKGVITDKGEYTADRVIVATGGISYPSTGSTGDGYRFARELGHGVIEPRPALAPMITDGGFPALSGLTLKNVTLNAYYEKKKISSEFGELLFTHSGVSGPIVLTTSSRINALEKSEIELFIDLKPALDFKTLDDRVLRDLAKFSKKQLKNSLVELLPSSLIPFVIASSAINGEKKTDDMTKEERKRLVGTLKAFPLEFRSLGKIDEAIVTSGGVSVKEIDPKTMESKIVKGLYFAGEVIDADALTGGFNLQIAWATGAKAGRANGNL